MKLDYIKRSCKTNRQELLDRALAEELEILRKKCFPWKRRDFLMNDITIKESKFTNTNQAGQYDYIDDIHIIQIDKGLTYSCNKFSSNYYRKSSYDKLRNVIRHELCHAFVEERYEDIVEDIKGKNRDGSPIFLTLLNWVDGVSGHECWNNFLHADFYNKSTCYFGTFKELDNYIIKMLFAYRRAIQGLKYTTNYQEFLELKINGINTISNDFMFSYYDCGFSKAVEVKRDTILKTNGKYIKNMTVSRTWEIGCNVIPTDLIELYNKKQGCYAEKYNYAKTLAEVNDGKMETLKVLKEKRNFGTLG